MKSLDELKKEQSQILLAEFTGLLHNVGKLAEKFINKHASDTGEVDYDFDKVVDPAQVVNIKTADAAILRPLSLAWITDLCDKSIWGGLQPAVVELKARLSGAPTALGGVRTRIGIARDVVIAAGVVSASQVTEVANKLASAAALADLLQPTPTSNAAFTLLDPIKQDGRQDSFLHNTEVKVLGAEAKLGEVILLMWDAYHGWPNDQQRNECLAFWLGKSSALQRYLMTAHGVVSGAEKGEGKRKQPVAKTFIATAFGYESQEKIIIPSELDVVRESWLTSLIDCTEVILKEIAKVIDKASNKAEQKLCYEKILSTRAHLLDVSQQCLGQALGETQRCYNDVTLWDFVSSIATLFKAALAKAVLENKFVETGSLQWRLLSIRYDGLEYLSRAHHISDLLARRDALEAALDEVKAVIEVEYPLGNEIYRDEKGSVLIVPDIEAGEDENVLLKLPCGDEGSLQDLLSNSFSGDLAQWLERRAESDKSNERPPLDGEIKPLVALSDALLGKQIKLPVSKNWNHPQLQADAEKVNEWWSDPQQHGDVCTVCGLRPQGYGAPKSDLREKAQRRQVCWVCLERRDERSQEWAQTALSQFQKTIWVDEVADNNGRVALVVGRFGLDGWLDGSLIPTMQKGDSFARIQRCWRTTETFWQEVERNLPQTLGSKFRPRLKIEPQDITFQPPADSFGRFHTYELEITGAHLSVVWNPDLNGKKDKGYFITCENLDYFQRIAAIKGYDNLKQRLAAGKINVYEPSAHLSRRNKLADFTVTAEGLTLVESLLGETQAAAEPASPFIRILTKPALFMALVPADKALDVANAIKTKYETEMGKVRDRLPLHVGLVFAPHRTPMRALLEAGRRMLEMPDRWERWTVQANNCDGASHNVSFEGSATWQVSAVMGDGSTEDKWYPHLMLREPLPGEDFTQLLPTDPKPWKRLKDLQTGDQVYVRPSRFDFEFLDVSARRNEISYTRDGRRRGLPTRPFLLEDIDRLDDMWKWLKPLTTSHLQHLEATLTSYITDWFNGDLANADDKEELEVFKKLAADVLRRLDGSWWKKLEKAQQDLLIEAVGNGRILDLLELRMHILKEKSEELPKQQEDAI